MASVFPRECQTLFRLARDGRIAEALPLYDWLMPVLHLDARSDLVQCIKLCGHLVGRGSLWTRPPRLPLEGAERDEVERIVKQTLSSRPELPDVGLQSDAA